ncbi:LacI family gluconate utilization system Gnt-I transcriptional repressor [Pseudomonas sp. BIGb0408]|uniref:LacI family gluconate utilization system Gnt-I transcriptional repressor n=2 Tax=Pseudomonadales TaxID=72274 RepID=A0A7Z0BN23_9GAMM|nr:LacI family gluconate utilization system Gnt-I transcriptional repressor [Pseudomonas sp. BIGb0408]NYH73117.1 LacI family gluconate utilization system Gnt-I transcriptional repressor [Pseudomonas flavescens]
MTVSRAIQRPELVNEATREHVLEIVRSMGYVPNIMAGALATRKSRLVAILLPTIANSIYSIAVQSIISRLSAFGYQSLVGPTGYSPENEELLLDAILGRRPDGIVLTGTLHTPSIRSRLASLRIPVVEAWDLSDALLDTQVGFSHEKVGVSVADHFHAKGYRRWAVVGIDDPRAMRRCHSLTARLNELDVSDVHQQIFPSEATWEVGRKGLTMLLDEGARPEIVICSSDTVALGVLAEAASRKMTVPDDIAVLGFGNISNGQFAYPSLSTVSVNAQEMGYQVAEALLRRLEGGSGESQVDTSFEIVEREST